MLISQGNLSSSHLSLLHLKSYLKRCLSVQKEAYDTVSDKIFNMVSFPIYLHCLSATRHSLNIMSLEESTSEVNTRTEMDEQLIQEVVVEVWKEKWFTQV